MKIAVITSNSRQTATDFTSLLAKFAELTIFCDREAASAELDGFDAFCVLGGTEKQPLLLSAQTRNKIEELHAHGKRFFVEYCGSFANMYSAPPRNTVYERLVYVGEATGALVPGDLLDEHTNDFTSPYCASPQSRPILYYGGKIAAFSHIEKPDMSAPLSSWGLYMYDENAMICSFRLCSFIAARFVPFRRWTAIVEMILSWLCGEKCEISPLPHCSLRGAGDNRAVSDENFDAELSESVRRGVEWIKNADILIDGGAGGVCEGLSHNIYADGHQDRVESGVRTDCTGEIGGVYMLGSLLSGSGESMKIYENTADFCFGQMMAKSGIFRGMLRWTSAAWGVCYQDDAARAMLPSLIKISLTGDKSRLRDIETALDFLVSTTGTDGLRQSRTDCPALDAEKIAELGSRPSNFPCAHYNAYYHAALLLAYEADGNEVYLDTARRGIASLMAVYPDTVREHSETQELCRLILPLALLYGITHEDEHLAWLFRVTADLERYRHISGGYAEYDDGYKAACSHNANGECSLLSDNGDPVADLLYSLNWLPLGFAFAWEVTRDEYFEKLWRNIAVFMMNAQIQSNDSSIDGAWARGIDLDAWELYGVPHDVGWGPCCVESGWTVAEILMGLEYGMLIKRKIIN
ncbi:MAG: hypothetical protein WCQ72_04700 [Eubacteriales bacterium]